MPNYSTIIDSQRVIYLGHSPNVPLKGSPSELSYGLEPHDLNIPLYRTAVRQYQSGGREEVYPGWCRLGGTGEGAIPGTTQPSTLRLI